MGDRDYTIVRFLHYWRFVPRFWCYDLDRYRVYSHNSVRVVREVAEEWQGKQVEDIKQNVLNLGQPNSAQSNRVYTMDRRPDGKIVDWRMQNGRSIGEAFGKLDFLEVFQLEEATYADMAVTDLQ